MMQVWLPLPSFTDSVRTLSNTHLWRVRIDVIKLMDSYHEVQESELPVGLRSPYQIDESEPLYKMWHGYEMQLCEYGLEACEEYTNRPSTPSEDFNLYEIISHHLDWATGEESDMGKPNWFGDVDVHISHQAALVRLDPDHYSKYFKVDQSLPLEWPKSRYAKD
jgi:hypothetical protein